MRLIPLIVIAIAPATTGCSCLIAFSGTDLERFESREQVVKKFGPPTEITFKDGLEVDHYHTHRKIYDGTIRTASLGMSTAMTYGLAELYTFPRELFICTRRTIFGQTISFEYDQNGQVTRATLDGLSVPWRTDTAATTDKKHPIAVQQTGSVASN